jgi:hypothetical protein
MKNEGNIFAYNFEVFSDRKRPWLSLLKSQGTHKKHV